MSMPKYEPSPQNEPPYDSKTQRQLRELQKAAGAVRRHEEGVRLARDQRDGRLYVLIADAGASQAKPANVCRMTRQGVAHVAREWAKENDWPWPPTMPPHPRPNRNA
jgi:hypothetical protein